MTSKTKILLAITKSNFGGAQRYVYDLATNVSKEKFEVSVLCGGEGLLVEKLRMKGVRVIAIPYLGRDIKIFDEFRAFFDLLRILRKEKPDVFHINSSKIGGLGSLAGRLVGIKKIIFTAHGWYFNEDRFWFVKLITWFLSWLTVIFSHKTIVVSYADQNTASHFPFVGKNKIALIHNGIGQIEFLEKNAGREILLEKDITKRHENDFWIVTVAELHSNKNLAAAILGIAAAKRAGQNIFYIIIGEGEERKNLEKLIEKEKVKEYIKLVGFVKDAPQYLRAFDCFLLTSKKEGLPYVLLEAGLAGLTSVATKIGGIPDIIENNATGYLIENTRPETVAKTLLSAQRNPSGEKLKSSIKDKFSLNSFLKQTESVYN